MSITRDAGYPAEYAQLMAAFNRAADGYDAVSVLNAALQMLAAAVGVQVQGRSPQEAEAYAKQVSELLLAIIRDNHRRQPQSGDVVVRSQ